MEKQFSSANHSSLEFQFFYKMASIKAFSLCLQSQSNPTKISNHYEPSLITPHHKHKPQTLSFQPSKQLHSIAITNFSQSQINHRLTSNFPYVKSSLSPDNRILKILREKVVVFLVGSVVFLGCFSFNARPSLALPSNLSSAAENLREKRETQMGEGEEEMYEKLLEKEPRDVEALKVVVYGKMRRGRNKEAVEFVKRLIDIEPNEVEWRLLEAVCYELMGQLSTAKRLLKEILKKRPLLLKALHGLAMVMHKNHEGPAVFEMLTRALEVARRDKRVTEERNIRILIAQMHVVKGQLEEGLKKFQDLVEENPRDFRPYLCQGIIYSLLDKKKEAAEQFEKYRSLVPEEYPQRGFMDDVVMAAKTKSGERLQREYRAEFSHRA